MAQIIQVVWCPKCHKYLGHYDTEMDIQTTEIVCECTQTIFIGA
jgi:uncharacterized protein YbaR (Trm112 family)